MVCVSSLDNSLTHLLFTLSNLFNFLLVSFSYGVCGECVTKISPLPLYFQYCFLPEECSQRKHGSLKTRKGCPLSSLFFWKALKFVFESNIFCQTISAFSVTSIYFYHLFTFPILLSNHTRCHLWRLSSPKWAFLTWVTEHVTILHNVIYWRSYLTFLLSQYCSPTTLARRGRPNKTWGAFLET